MINPVILSEINVDEAIKTFNQWRLQEPVTLLIVPGKHLEALQALEKANEMINSGSDFYASVRVIHAPSPEFIIPILQMLKANPDMKAIDWNNFGQYAVLSVSNKYNNIGNIITNIDFPTNSGGKINTLVRHAQAFDRPLN